jgi:hypothetical protein
VPALDIRGDEGDRHEDLRQAPRAEARSRAGGVKQVSVGDDLSLDLIVCNHYDFD